MMCFRKRKKFVYHLNLFRNHFLFLSEGQRVSRVCQGPLSERFKVFPCFMPVKRLFFQLAHAPFFAKKRLSEVTSVLFPSPTAHFETQRKFPRVRRIVLIQMPSAFSMPPIDFR